MEVGDGCVFVGCCDVNSSGDDSWRVRVWIRPNTI